MTVEKTPYGYRWKPYKGFVNGKIVWGKSFRLAGLNATPEALYAAIDLAEQGISTALPNYGLHELHPREYSSWGHMKSRCQCETDDNYEYYGARGISVCERWQKFENFLKDMGERPEGTSIDRIDVNGDYEPDNCRWADATTQSENRRERNPEARINPSPK